MHKFLFIVTVFSLAFGQYMAIFKNSGTNIYLFDLAVAMYGFFYFVYLLINDKKFIVSKFYLAFLCFIIWTIITFLLNQYLFAVGQLLVGSFYILRLLIYAVAGLAVYNLILTKRLSREFVISCIILSGVLISFLGVLQLIFIPDFEKLDPLLGWDPHKNRLAATFFDPNFTGAYLVLCSSFSAFGFLSKKINKNFYIVTLAILFSALVFTFSRSAWVMFAVVIFIYGFYKNKKLLFISLLVAFLAYYSVPRIQTRISGITDPADSAAFRFISWKNTTQIIDDNIYVGVGYNFLRSVQKDKGFIDYDSLNSHAASGSDSSLLFVAATTGLVGLILFIYVLYLGSLSSLEAFALFFALIVNSQFINSLVYPQILFIWILIPQLLSANYLTSRT